MTQSFRNYLLLVLMLLSAAVAVLIKPTHRIAETKPPIALEKIIPAAFGDWREIENSNQQIINPEEREMLSALYSQTLAKVFVNSKGYRIMLSVAYGSDQSRDLSVHRPEVCYVAQGFQLSNQAKTTLQINGRDIPAMHMESHLGARHEPVTYWIRIGDKVVRGNLELGFARLAYGLRGQIADGLLFRVSSLDLDAQAAFTNQEQFVRDLSAAIVASDLPSLFGLTDSQVNL